MKSTDTYIVYASGIHNGTKKGSLPVSITYLMLKMMVGRELGLLPINLKTDMKIQNIFFDLDGTLINSSRGIKYSITKSLASVLPDFTLDHISDSLIGPTIGEIFRQIIGSSDLALIDKLTQAYRNSYDNEGWEKTDIYEGVIETLCQFAQLNITMFIVTNKPGKPTFKILDHLNMLHFFADVASPDTVDPPYTSKSAICQHILTKYHVNREYTLLVGDSRDDAHAAKSCGLSFIAATYGYGKVHESETSEQLCKIYSFPELIGVLKSGFIYR